MASILIDLQACQTESRYRGLGRYASALAKAVAAQADGDEIHILLNSAFPQTLANIRRQFFGIVQPENIHVVELLEQCEDRSAHLRWRHQASALLREAYIDMFAPDVVFCPSFFEGYIDAAVVTVGRFSSVPVVTTVHDFIPMIYSKEYFRDNPDFERHYMSKLREIRNSKRIITISECSSNDVLNFLNVSPDIVQNASEASDAQFRDLNLSAREREATLRHFGLNRPFIFYTGGSDPRKNLSRLISAFSRLPADLQREHQLVLAGNMPELDQSLLLNEGRRLGLPTDAIKFLGYVDDAELVRLYNIAEVFVFPSLYEGFGLPCLEAFQCGTAVLGAAASSLPEVIGNEEALFDPLSISDMSAKIEKVLTDPIFRARLVEQGREHAARFSWEKSAALALRTIRDANESSADLEESWEATRNRIEECERRFVGALAALDTEIANPTEQDLMQVARAMARNRTAAEARLRGGRIERPIEWRLEGPFDSSYSLAIVNRSLGLALDAEGENVSLRSMDGPGEFAPDGDFLAGNPALAALHERSRRPIAQHAEVVSRNVYPPRVIDMDGRINGVHNYAWEETGFPTSYADGFNESLQFATVTSSHVKRLLINAGVSVPIAVVGNGIDHWVRIRADPNYCITKAGYTFLHVSSCFPRKGADVLLDAYGEAFSDADDVLLVIKSFRNPHNQIEEMLKERQASNPRYPHVLLVMEDITDSELKSVYEQCNALVAPSRAEGFGLPIAEAVLSGLHVIATGWSGQMDFLNADYAELIDYRFVRAKSHEPNQLDSVWAEPSVAHLASLMASAASRHAGQPHLPVKQQFLQTHSWRSIARKNVDAAKRAAELPPLADPLIGWMSTYGKRCGIATYSQHILDVLGLPTVILAPYCDETLARDGGNVCTMLAGREGGPLR